MCVLGHRNRQNDWLKGAERLWITRSGFPQNFINIFAILTMLQLFPMLQFILLLILISHLVRCEHLKLKTRVVFSHFYIPSWDKHLAHRTHWIKIYWIINIINIILFIKNSNIIHNTNKHHLLRDCILCSARYFSSYFIVYWVNLLTSLLALGFLIYKKEHG